MRSYPELASILDSEMFLGDVADYCVSPHRLTKLAVLPQTFQAAVGEQG
jgi:hypothetical protein